MNIPESFSIRQRVFTLGAVLLACALIGLVFFLRGYAQRAAEQAFDRLLAASAGKDPVSTFASSMVSPAKPPDWATRICMTLA